jgi:hypothetical protein
VNVLSEFLHGQGQPDLHGPGRGGDFFTAETASAFVAQYPAVAHLAEMIEIR